MTVSTVSVLELLLAADGHRSTVSALAKQSGESCKTVSRVLRRLAADQRVTVEGRRRPFAPRIYTLSAVEWARKQLAERRLSPSTRWRRRVAERVAAERGALGAVTAQDARLLRPSCA